MHIIRSNRAKFTFRVFFSEYSVLDLTGFQPIYNFVTLISNRIKIILNPILYDMLDRKR